MTQFIPFREGKIYDTAHLRPFDLELAKQGHPIAHYSGGEVSALLDYGGDVYLFIFALNGSWINRVDFGIAEHLRLAPLAIKDGRTLHIGCEVEVSSNPYLDGVWTKLVIDELDTFKILGIHDVFWRWPVDDLKVEGDE